MAKTDEELGNDLRSAFGKDLPGEEFDRGVMERLGEEGGGEHELSAARGRPWPRLIRWAAAAAALLLVAFAAHRIRSTPAESPPVERTTHAQAGERDRVVIEITLKGEIRVDGQAVELEELARHLSARTAGSSEVQALIRCDREVPWREVQKVMQACSDPLVRIEKIQFGTLFEKETAPPPPAKTPPAVWLELRRKAGGDRTTLRFGGEDAGDLDAALEGLSDRIAGAVEGKTGGVRISAWTAVPMEDVVRVIDAAKQAGVEEITFEGVPPPRPRPKIGTVRVLLRRRGGETSASFSTTFKQYGLLEFLPELAKKLEARRNRPGKTRGEIHAGAGVENRDVLRVMEAFLAAGVSDVAVTGEGAKKTALAEARKKAVGDYAEARTAISRHPAIVAILLDAKEEDSIRESAAQAIRKRFRSVPPLDKTVRKLKLEIGVALVKLLNDRELSVRTWAAGVFRDFWPGQYAKTGYDPNQVSYLVRTKQVREWQDYLETPTWWKGEGESRSPGEIK